MSAVDTFFGDGPLGADGETPVGGVFTGGGIDALAPNADSGGGYAALSALPVFFGSNNANTNFGPGVFTGGGSLRTVELRCAERHPGVPQSPAQRGAGLAAAQQQTPLAAARSSTAGGTGEHPAACTDVDVDDADRWLQPGQTFSLPKLQALTPPAPQALTPPAPPQVEPAATPGDNSGPQLNVSRVSEKFTPKGIGDNPLLLGGGGQNAGEGMRGYGSLLKKVGLGGGGE